MKIKHLLFLLVLPLVVFALASCTISSETEPDDGGTPTTTTYTVVFFNEEVRHKTLKVEAGKTITEEIEAPFKSGSEFKGWTLDGELVDLATLVINSSLNLYAYFEEQHMQIDETLVVDDVKDPLKDYTLVIGWWECTDTKEVDGEQVPKLTSYLDETQVRMIYMNIIDYLKAFGFTADDLEKVSVRNYSTKTVAEMGELVNADADVDILIGVGNNINSTAGVSLLNGNEGKTDVTMGTTPTSRKVAILATAEGNEAAISLYEWIKNTEAGKDAFKELLEEAEIEVYVEQINLEVHVHGDTEEITTLQDKETAVTMPEITVDDDHEFLGFSFTEDGELELIAEKDASLKYDDLKDHATLGVVHLYPVIQEKAAGDGILSIYLHKSATSSVYIDDEEIATFEELLKYLYGEEGYALEIIEGVKADAFNSKVLEDGASKNIDVVIGGNTITSKTPQLVAENKTVLAHIFSEGSRRVGILPTAQNKELAQTLVDALTEAEKVVIYVHLSYNDSIYITEDEISTLTTHLSNLIGSDNFQIVTVENKNAAGFNTEVKAQIAEGAEVNICIGGKVISTKDPILVESATLVGAGIFANDSRYFGIMNKGSLFTLKVVQLLTNGIGE